MLEELKCNNCGHKGLDRIGVEDNAVKYQCPGCDSVYLRKLPAQQIVPAVEETHFIRLSWVDGIDLPSWASGGTYRFVGTGSTTDSISTISTGDSAIPSSGTYIHHNNSYSQTSNNVAHCSS